jgi:hypothetical protein
MICPMKPFGGDHPVYGCHLDGGEPMHWNWLLFAYNFESHMAIGIDDKLQKTVHVFVHFSQPKDNCDLVGMALKEGEEVFDLEISESFFTAIREKLNVAVWVQL